MLSPTLNSLENKGGRQSREPRGSYTYELGAKLVHYFHQQHKTVENDAQVVISIDS